MINSTNKLVLHAMSIIVLQFPLAAVLLLLSVASTTKATAAAQALSGCSDKCGDLTIPYPFGMKKDCFLNEKFFINCNHSTQPPTAYLMGGNVVVTNISLDGGELRILNFVALDCYDAQGSTIRTKARLTLPLPYTISDTKNRFIAVGCDTYTFLGGFIENQPFFTGCTSICNSLDSVDNNSCSGVGCCETKIPNGLYNRTVQLNSYYNHSHVLKFNPCSYAFVVEQGQFNFSPASFIDLKNTEKLPMVLNWAIGNSSCDDAQKIREDFACKANSRCVNRPIGYLCQCLPGYEGNPYHLDGCQDIDECKAPNPCHHGKCSNSLGNYSCSCHKGYKHDGRNDRICIKKVSKMEVLLIVSLGASVGSLVLFLGISWICWGMKKREFIKLKEKYFKENGGLLLLQQLASHGSSMKTTQMTPKARKSPHFVV